MSEPDAILEIELLTRNHLSQDNNLDEYENVDTTLLSPRRFPLFPDFGSNIRNEILNVLIGDEEDNQSHSSGFSSSIPNTVKDIDNVLNEIRIRSSPDPKDFVGYYYDDDAMTEKSYQTNTKLYMELNKAHESFMGSISSTPEDLDGLLGKHADDSSIDGSENWDSDDLENDAAIELNLLHSNEKYERRSNRYDNNHVGDYQVDNYENNYVYTPKKNRSHGNVHYEDNNSDNTKDQEWGFGSNENYSFEGQQHLEPRDCWNEIHHSEKELEESRPRGHVHQQWIEKNKPPTSFLGSKLMSCWCRRPRRLTHQRQPEERQQRRQQQRPHSEELAFAILSSRKQTKLFWIATGCSTLAIVFVMLGAIFMATETSWSKFMPPQEPALIIDDPFYSNSGQINFTAIQTNVVTIDSPTILPTTPAMPSSASTITDAPSVLPTQFDTLLEPRFTYPLS